MNHITEALIECFKKIKKINELEKGEFHQNHPDLSDYIDGVAKMKNEEHSKRMKFINQKLDGIIYDLQTKDIK